MRGNWALHPAQAVMEQYMKRRIARAVIVVLVNILSGEQLVSSDSHLRHVFLSQLAARCFDLLTQRKPSLLYVLLCV